MKYHAKESYQNLKRGKDNKLSLNVTAKAAVIIKKTKQYYL